VATLTAETEKLIATIKTVPRVEQEPKRLERPKPAVNNGRGAVNHGNLTGPEQRILNAIAWMESIGVEEPEQTAVAFMAGYTYGGGAFNNPRGRLNVLGMVEYVAGNKIKLTEVGRNEAEFPAQIGSNEELHSKVMDRLPGPESKLLSALLAVYPKAMTNEELAEASGYTEGGGAFANPKGRLRTLGLIAYPSKGIVRAKDLLFPM
jgi:hypothetical protein